MKHGGVAKSKTLGLVTEERGHRSTSATVGREKDGGRQGGNRMGSSGRKKV